MQDGHGAGPDTKLKMIVTPALFGLAAFAAGMFASHTGKAQQDPLTSATEEAAQDVNLPGAPDGALASYGALAEATERSPEELAAGQPGSDQPGWWVADSGFSDCHGSGGPAAQLDDYAGHTDQPQTHDFRDAAGNLEKVEVVIPRGGGMEGVTTYYKDRATCLAEQVNRTQDLADRYRGL